MRPDVSVIIPTFARQLAAMRAARSAVRQRGVRAEIIIVDDGSPEPIQLSSDLQSHGVRLIRRNQNRGPAAARNQGVAASTAEHIAFLDSDDFLLPHTLLDRLHAYMKVAPGGAVVLAAGVVRWRPGVRAAEYIPAEADGLRLLASGCWYFPGSTALFSRELWEKVGPLDATLRRLEDLDWGIRLARAGGRVSILPRPVAVVQYSGSARLAAVQNAASVLLRRYGSAGPMPIDAAAFRQLSAYLDLEIAKSSLGEQAFGRFVISLAKSFLRVPRSTVQLQDWWVTAPLDKPRFDEIERFALNLSG
jgi:glycosyltransferase involved in cell wall biosynthesis